MRVAWSCANAASVFCLGLLCRPVVLLNCEGHSKRPQPGLRAHAAPQSPVARRDDKTLSFSVTAFSVTAFFLNFQGFPSFSFEKKTSG